MKINLTFFKVATFGFLFGIGCSVSFLVSKISLKQLEQARKLNA